MSEFQQTTIHVLKLRLPDSVKDVYEFRGETTIFVESASFLDVMKTLRDEPILKYDLLEDIVADDYLDRDPRFAVSYHLYSIVNQARIRIRVQIEDPEVGPPSLDPLWKIASWLELEVYDLMGIHFQDHPGLRRIFLPMDWQGHPLRKDYPLGYEEVQFSFNYEEIQAKKPAGKKG